MMSSNNFYTFEEVRPLYDEIIPAYQEAFAVPPWNEVSKCADRRLRCAGGLSAVAVGSLCDTCGVRPTNPAYESDELVERFEALGASRPTAWYVEQNESAVTMAAVAWRATSPAIAEEKYEDVPDMKDWMIQELGDQPVMWLDEVFANRTRKPKGNLQNFGKFVVGLAEMLDCDTVAYRTIEPRMTTAPIRDFGDNAHVSTCNSDVPDRRNFIIIENVKESI